jgi:hypothetical protein
MNSNWAPLFVAGSLLVLTTDIAAQEQAVLGQGNVSCGSWLNDRKGDDTDASSRIAWVLGYVTAFNQYESKPAGDVSGAKGTEEIMAWIDKLWPTSAIILGRQLLVNEFRHNLNQFHPRSIPSGQHAAEDARRWSKAKTGERQGGAPFQRASISKSRLTVGAERLAGEPFQIVDQPIPSAAHQAPPCKPLQNP